MPQVLMQKLRLAINVANANDPALEQYGGVSWFGLGDRDLGTHLYRTQRLSDGADLAPVTAEITRAWSLDVRLLPVTCDALRYNRHARGTSGNGNQRVA